MSFRNLIVGQWPMNEKKLELHEQQTDPAPVQLGYSTTCDGYILKRVNETLFSKENQCSGQTQEIAVEPLTFYESISTELRSQRQP